MAEPSQLDDLRHELRTPLNHIIGYAEMMLEDVQAQARAPLVAPLQGIVGQARVLLDRIKELGGAADVEAARGRLRELASQLTAPLASMAASIATLAAMLADGADAELRKDVDRMSQAAERLRALLRPDPAEAAPAAPARAAAPASTGRSGAAILVVDDNENNREVLTRRLNREGYRQVVQACDGREALDLLARQPFDLVLLDIMMPNVDGYQVLEAMKRDESLRHIPVIMISALDEMKSVIRCVEQGAEDYLSKPFDPTLLRARVNASLEKKRLRDEVVEWGRTLEARVQEQVAQLDRLGKLKGFFSPQVAESILGKGERALDTHRREVVVVFLDLRGFTAFTDTSEPEEVMGVLGEYHAVMGRLVMAHEGTLDAFLGDGLMIVFNDPLPVEDPTGRAVRMALEMQRDFVPLRDEWQRRGHNLGLGIGIAIGYATLGVVGFEGRWAYTCIGGVANLAARLCGEAKAGQILVSEKALKRVAEAAVAEPVGEMTLKGISLPQSVYNVTGMKG
ncbi:MAG TPA: response regulator [Usitatibacter sp.]|nr:response regulator [Usitatibacter sp.]